MRKITFFILFSIYSCLYAQEKTGLATDGPYLLYEAQGTRLIQVDTAGLLRDTLYKTLPDGFLFHVTSRNRQHQFDVALHAIQRPAWKHKQPEKIFVISDPHGDMDCFVSILKGGKIINEHYQWTFGKNHLVIIGDVFDRGNDVLPIFWLIYKLEQESEEAGGKVSFLLGNHEEMVLRGNVKYTPEKYKRIADTLHLSYNMLWQANSELGRWLKTKNTMQVINKNLFVHAGLSPEFLSKHLDIQTVNDTISHYLLHTKEGRAASELAAFLFGDSGPLWYRGMVRTDAKYNPISMPEVNEILKTYHVDRIYVGHTIFTDITGFYNEKIIGVNVDNKDNRDAERARGILIEGDKVRAVYDSGRLLERF
jgi:hypothetical protein